MKKILFILFFFFVPLLVVADPLKKAESLLQANKSDEALKVLEEFLREHPENVDAHEAIQKIMLNRRGESEIIAEYEAKYQRTPTGLNAHLYGKLLESPSEKEALFRQVREKHPQEIWGHFGLANALLDQDRLQEAAHVAEEGVTYVSNPARLHYVAARTYRRMKDFAKAVAQAKLALQADVSNEDYPALVQSYEWIQIAETENPQEKFDLAQKYYRKHKEKLYRVEDFDGVVALADLAYIYAENDVETMREIVQKAQKGMRNVKRPEDTEEREFTARVKGSLVALQAVGEAMEGKQAQALKTLKRASGEGEGSETFYFAAITHDKLGDKNAALQQAIKASLYPPAYSKAASFAASLWKQVHGSDAGFQDALNQQKKTFASRRKSRVLAQMVSEDHQEFTMVDRDGKKVTKHDLIGKVILMNFWAVWCPPCREELPHWNAFYLKHKNDPEVALVSVGDEPWETINNYMMNQNLDFEVYRNEDFWEQFDVNGIPTLLVIDRQGKIRFRNVGFEEGMEYEETLEWQIQAVKAK
jgi:thiol-disulfide isomerase/thioredoxin